MDPELLRYVKLLVKSGVAVLALVGIYLLFNYVVPILGAILGSLPALILPFLLAILLAILIEPVIEFFEKKARMKRAPATMISLLLVLSLLGFLVFAAISRLIIELAGIYKLFSGRSSDLGQLIVEGLQKVQVFYVHLNLSKDLQNSLQSNLLHIFDTLQQSIGSVVNILVNLISGLPGLLIFFLIATIATYFIAKERREIRAWFLSILPESWEGKTQNVFRDLSNAFLGFLKAEAILVSITGFQTIIGLKILDVKYALTLGLLTGLFDILPILGPGTIFVPWIIWEFIKGNTGFGVGLLILYLTITVVRQLLEPRIIGDNIGLHPLATLFSLYVGLKLAGVLGMIMGPILVILFLACRRAGVFEGLSFKKK